MARGGPIPTHEFTVEGHGEFPLDMLRYDRCWPKTEADDSRAMESSYLSSPVRRVTLVTISEGAPTVGRWESFGWRIVPMIKASR